MRILHRRKRARYKEALEKLRDYNPPDEADKYAWEKLHKKLSEEPDTKPAIKAFMFGLFVGAMVTFQMAPIIRRMLEAILGV